MKLALKHWIRAIALTAGIATGAAVSQTVSREAGEWPAYGGSPANIHYSTLAQINRKNVSQLREIWRFDTQEKGGLETSPLIINGILYAYTPTQKVFALNAATGQLLWEFAPDQPSAKVQRGLAYWKDGNDKRILAGISRFVYALDATTGKVVPAFGETDAST